MVFEALTICLIIWKYSVINMSWWFVFIPMYVKIGVLLYLHYLKFMVDLKNAGDD